MDTQPLILQLDVCHARVSKHYVNVHQEYLTLLAIWLSIAWCTCAVPFSNLICTRTVIKTWVTFTLVDIYIKQHQKLRLIYQLPNIDYGTN